MNNKRPNNVEGQAEVDAKRLKPDEEQSQCDPVVAGPSNEQVSPFANFKVVGLEEIFEYLPLQDLYSVSLTCKRLHKVAGQFFNQNYAAENCFINEDDDIYVDKVIATGFKDFNKRLVFTYGRNTGLRRFQELCGRSVKRILLAFFEPSKILQVKEVFSRVEELDFRMFPLTRENYTTLRDHCPSLRRLNLNGFNRKSSKLISYANDGSIKTYPTLEHLLWDDFVRDVKSSDDELPALFEQNPNLKSFGVNTRYLWRNNYQFITAKAKLVELSIFVYRAELRNFDKICDLLNKLYDQGFYKKLSIYYMGEMDQKSVDDMISLKALTKLFVSQCETGVDLSALITLKDLATSHLSEIANIETLAKNLINLERVCFGVAKIKDVQTFIRHSVNLKVIKLECGRYRTGLNLKALNEERVKLPWASKILMYVNGESYLKMNWAQVETNYKLIELKRGDSYVFDENCDDVYVYRPNF